MLRLFATATLLLSLPCSALTEDPKPSYDWHQRGVTAFEAQDYPRAEEAFLEALETEPRNVKTVLSLSDLYLTTARRRDAAKLIEDSINEGLTDPVLSLKLGDIYASIHQYGDAAGAYEAALKKIRGVARKLGTIYVIQNRVADAKKMYQRALDEERFNPTSYLNLSSLYLLQNKPEEAVSILQRGARTIPNGKLYAALGMAYESSGNRKRALEAYKSALKLNSSTPEVAEAVARLSQ